MSKNNRRNFIRQMMGLGCASLTLSPYLSSITNLQAMNAAALNNSAVNLTNSSSYKALVCIMLAGGNDSFNMLVPTDNNSADYLGQRGTMVLDNTIPLSPNNLASQSTYGQFGLHPKLSNIAGMFNGIDPQKSKVSFISNIGTLVRPTNFSEYSSGNSLPVGLFSHSDQVKHWQTSQPDKRSAIGWGGRMIDLLSANDNNPYSHISLDGVNLFQRGELFREYALNPDNGAAFIWGDSDSATGYYGPYYQRRKATIDSLTVDSLADANYMNILQKSYLNTLNQARASSIQLGGALQGVNLTTSFNNTSLEKQLEMVAKTIRARGTLGVNRQTFYVVHTGYDTHDEMIDRHEDLMAELDNALSAFDEALGELQVRNQVTTFTVSDFARTLRSNGDGTDHGWGGHVMVMGGDINGGQILGDYPHLIDGSSYKISGGRFIPTTSCDEYFADLALWFAEDGSTVNGCSLTFQELKDILPNIGEFYSSCNNVISDRLGLFA